MDTALKNLNSQNSENIGTPYTGSPGSYKSVLGFSHDHGQCNFRPWTMICMFSLHWTVSWVIFAIGVIVTLKPFGEESPCQVFYLLVYLRAGFWFGTYMLNEKIKDPCRKLISNNYVLYQNMTTYRKAPLQIVSFWNTALIAVNGYAKDLLKKGDMESFGKCRPIDNDVVQALTSPQLLIVIFCGIESMALSFFYIGAIVRLIGTSRVSVGQFTQLHNELTVDQVLKQQSEQIKLLQKEQDKLKREAVNVGVVDDD